MGSSRTCHCNPAPSLRPRLSCCRDLHRRAASYVSATITCSCLHHRTSCCLHAHGSESFASRLMCWPPLGHAEGRRGRGSYGSCSDLWRTSRDLQHAHRTTGAGVTRQSAQRALPPRTSCDARGSSTRSGSTHLQFHQKRRRCQVSLHAAAHLCGERDDDGDGGRVLQRGLGFCF